MTTGGSAHTAWSLTHAQIRTILLGLSTNTPDRYRTDALGVVVDLLTAGAPVRRTIRLIRRTRREVSLMNTNPTRGEVGMLLDSVAEENLLRAIFDSSPCNEPYHEDGCPACDIAAEVVGSLAAYWDTGDTWWTELITDAKWPTGITTAMQAEKIVAFVLHRQMPKNTENDST